MATVSSLRVDTKSITVLLKMSRLFGFRCWLMMQVLKLAGLISPFTIAVSNED